jgi:hypothetical protein
MKKVHKVIISFFVIMAIVLIALYGIYLSKSNQVSIPNGDVLYYGITCPHCKIVEQFIEEKNISSKIEFKNKEVYQNKANANELIAVGKFCKIESQYVGAVPLLYYNKTCYLGDVDIITILNKTLENK